MTNLDAVNEILRKAGGYAVSVLEPSGASSASEAQRCLVEANRKIQLIKWNFNTRRNVELTPDVNDKIAVPSGTLYCDSCGVDAWRNIAHRGQYLYDMDNNVDTFDGPVKVELVELWDFPCVPEYVANYIACSAAVAFNSQRGARDRDRDIYMACEAAKRFAVTQNARQNDVSYLGTADAQDLKGNRTPSRFYFS